MKNIYFILIGCLVVLSSCYEEPDWLGDNATTEGKHFPVIGTLSVSESSVVSGNSVELDLRYWSFDPILETHLIEKADGASDFSIVDTYPYSFNFNEETQDEQLILVYTAPTVTDTVDYEIGARVVNENGLEKERTLSITIFP